MRGWSLSPGAVSGRSGPRWLALTPRAALIVSAGLCLTLAAALLRLPQLPPRENVIGAFATGLRGRTNSQMHNLRLALAALDGQAIAPGAELSFNRAVGPWSVDRGYRRAPVSFSGEMALDWGGGVCQASTTLYNAALLAGLPIRERHRHHWPATYVPPGQDAAVAYPGIDLRFRNCFDAPIRITARIEGESALIQLRSRARAPRVTIEREVLAMAQPATVAAAAYGRPAGRPYLRRAPTRGQPGCEVAVYRRFLSDAGKRELISRDTYPPLNRLVWQ